MIAALISSSLAKPAGNIRSLNMMQPSTAANETRTINLGSTFGSLATLLLIDRGAALEIGAETVDFAHALRAAWRICLGDQQRHQHLRMFAKEMLQLRDIETAPVPDVSCIGNINYLPGVEFEEMLVERFEYGLTE